LHGFAHVHPVPHKKKKKKHEVTEEEYIVGYGEFVFAAIMAVVGVYRAWVTAHKTDDFEIAHQHLLEHTSSEEGSSPRSEEGSAEEHSDSGDESGKMPPVLPEALDEEEEEDDE